VSVTPASAFRSGLQAEFDTKYREFRTLTASGTHVWTGGTTTLSWSQQFFVEGLAGFNDPNRVRRSLSITSNPHTPDNRYGGLYSISYDAVQAIVLQQSMSAYYNAQCCGFAFRYVTSNRGFAPVPRDHGFSFSVTLAGLGSFSPLEGLSGVPR
jgi:hypothetical protein